MKASIKDCEIMAPVGSRESLAAAIQAGADVYKRQVPILSTFQLIFRDKNIICQSAVLGQQKGVEFLYFQCADKMCIRDRFCTTQLPWVSCLVL